MKLVTFIRAMAPHVPGETRILPDEVAARLAAEGVIAPDPPDWGGAEGKPPVVRSPLFGRDRPRPRQTYLTKEEGRQ